MVDLIALTPCAGLLPVETDRATLTEVTLESLLSVAPFAGLHDTVSAALTEQIGLPLPPPGQVKRQGDAVLQWFGHGTWVTNADVVLPGFAAITDQTDGWACVRLSGADAEPVLARLVPIDLRIAKFGVDRTARTMLGHMSVAITRIDSASFEIMVMRSMAATLVHDISGAMQAVAAR